MPSSVWLRQPQGAETGLGFIVAKVLLRQVIYVPTLDRAVSVSKHG
jgi:hypothetical protein